MSDSVVVVANEAPVPVDETTQPFGICGIITPSKFSLNLTIDGVPNSLKSDEETSGIEEENRPENKNKTTQIRKYFFNIGLYRI